MRGLKLKESGDYSVFKPALENLLSIVRERAACLDSSAPPYAVILDDFNPGTDPAKLEHTFGRLANGLSSHGAVADVEPMPAVTERFEVARQQAFMRKVASQLGYDFQGGRLDDSEHPFTVSMGPGDVRITTHLYDDDLLGGLGGTIHEAGHGIRTRPTSYVERYDREFGGLVGITRVTESLLGKLHRQVSLIF